MKEIELHNGMTTQVDDDDFDNLSRHSWRYRTFPKSRTGYVVRYTRIGTIYMHRVILNAPLGTSIDHIDQNGLNNQKSNLRFCTHTENIRNIAHLKNNTSGYKGVYYFPESNQWRARICVNGKSISLGLHDTKVDAARAYDSAALEHFGQFASLNFPTKESQ